MPLRKKCKLILTISHPGRNGQGVYHAGQHEQEVGFQASHRCGWRTAGKAILKQSYSVLQDDFFEYMRKAGYTDVERGSSEEHLTVTQFKVEKEQERLAALTRQTAQKSQEVASLGKRVEKIQKQNVALDAVEKIEAKPAMLSPTKVTLEKSEYEQLKTAARKYVAMERQESKLQKLLDDANRLIADLRSQIAILNQELSKYKSVRNRLSNANLEQENERLRGKIRTYEDVISHNNLWDFFRPNRNKNRNRDDAR